MQSIQSMTNDISTLIQHINAAFGDLQNPSGDHIVMDSSSSDLEAQRIKNMLKGLNWSDVPFETLDQVDSALAFLSPEGYRFYIPAFMTYSVIDFVRADIIPYEVVQSLTLHRQADVDRLRELSELHPEAQPFSRNEWEQILKTMQATYGSGSLELIFWERVAIFDATQARANREYLEYVRDVHGEEFPNREPEIALERYWYRF